MTRIPEELDPELAALEAELRADSLPDPGSAFFTELQQQVMQEVDRRPVPRHTWWRRLGELGRWAWRPAPVSALAGAAAVVLVALVLVGDRGGEQSLDTGAMTAGVVPGTQPGAGDVVPARRSPAGPGWIATLPPTEELWALQDDKLPTLLAVLTDDRDDSDALGPMEPVNELSLERLSDEELRALERMLPAARTSPPRPRPAPSMRRPG